MAHGQLGASFSLSDSWGVGGSVGYSFAHSLQRFDEPVVLSINDEPIPATIRHDRTADLHSLFIEPIVMLTLSRTQFCGGLRLGYAFQAPYMETQEVIDPPGVTINGSAVAIDVEGSYPGLQPFMATAIAGVRTTGQRIGAFRLEPGVTFAVGLTTLSTVQPVRQFSAGLDLRLQWDPEPERIFKIDTTITTDTVYTERAGGPAPDAVTIVSIDSTVVDLDNIRLTTIHIRQRLTRTIAMPSSTLFTEARARFLDDRGRAVTSWQIAYRETMHTATVSLPASCTVDLPSRSATTRIDALRSLSRHLSADCREMLDTMVQPPPAITTLEITWTDVEWEPCRVRFELITEGDVEVDSWLLRLYTDANAALDSVTGDGAPAPTLDYSFTKDVMALLLNGATIHYEFVAFDIDGGRTQPVHGTLSFNPADTDDVITQRWELVMPWQELTEGADVMPWSLEELEELRALDELREVSLALLSVDFWKRCRFVRLP
jgi:hypothetical protein